MHKTYFIQISIGPVQEFIAQARRTRDLWFGSYLLSDLSYAGAVALQEQIVDSLLKNQQSGDSSPTASIAQSSMPQPQMIFPALPTIQSKQDDASDSSSTISQPAPSSDSARSSCAQSVIPDAQSGIANKLTAIIYTDNPEQVAYNVYQAVQQKWKEQAQSALTILEEEFRLFVKNRADKKPLPSKSFIHRGSWERQINDLIEFYASWQQLNLPDANPASAPQHKDHSSEPLSYTAATDLADERIAARKTLRDFKANEPARMFGDSKSQLDPGRESVWAVNRWEDKDEFWAAIEHLGVSANETLDAVSIVKRLSLWKKNEQSNAQPMPASTQAQKLIHHGAEQSSFHSVCEIAFIPYRKQLEHMLKQCHHDNQQQSAENGQAEASRTIELLETSEHATNIAKKQQETEQHWQKALHTYTNTLKQILNDVELPWSKDENDSIPPASLFYHRRIREYLAELKGQGKKAPAFTGQLLDEKTEQVQQKLADYIKDTARLAMPSPYYAFLLADGDRMGEHLRNNSTPAQHVRISQALTLFTKAARELIEKDGGVLVYGGGDDVMAYLPLDTCFDTVQRLRNTFAKIVSCALDYVAGSDAAEGKQQSSTSHSAAKQLHTQQLKQVTMSIGMVIVHMLEPLEEVRELAAKAEKDAKKTRDALAVYLQRRSGGDQLRVRLPFQIRPAVKTEYPSDQSAGVTGKADVGTDATSNQVNDATAEEQPVIHSATKDVEQASTKAALYDYETIAGQFKQLQLWYENKQFSARFAYELREIYMMYARLLKDDGNNTNQQSSLRLLGNWALSAEKLCELLEQEVRRLTTKKNMTKKQATVAHPNEQNSSDLLVELKKFAYWRSVQQVHNEGCYAVLENFKRIAEMFILVVQLHETKGVEKDV
ncbi:type III-B CRISPR-associated protein Cas10/Cmr2 [Paenibacillus campi]|uniref:type III-B CRISPR-associated protein Cas10/Cmr2 n=1 Tax=Paenibacillus campi TaxID=3106031 RepID=UPI002AFF4176|nr:type III-B CRISPR-associated protein Cas10/Cmr2 [Paenibacillus sp. SGZ-1014]